MQKRDETLLEVHIDKGMKDGQKITFSGMGDQEVSFKRQFLAAVFKPVYPYSLIIFCVRNFYDGLYDSNSNTYGYTCIFDGLNEVRNI